MLVAAALWAFLWGPIGLILSSPITVCMVVLGKYVPQLKFLDVLIGDEPPLDAHVTFYQRLLARDQDEATQLILAQYKASSPEQVYDDFLVPALNYTKRDRERDDLTESDEEFVLQATREILEDLGERRDAATQVEEAIHAEDLDNTPAPIPLHVLTCPARDQADRLALEMLRQLLDPAKWVVEIAAVETMAADLVAQVAEQTPALVCVAPCRRAGWPTHATCARSCVPGSRRSRSSWPMGAHGQHRGKPGATPGRRGRPDSDHTVGNAEPTEQSAAHPGTTTGKVHRELTCCITNWGGLQKATQGWRKAMSMGRLGGGKVVQIVRLLKQTGLEWYKSRTFELAPRWPFMPSFPSRQ